MTCDICSDLMEPGIAHYCPPVNDRYDSANLGTQINLVPYAERP